MLRRVGNYLLIAGAIVGPLGSAAAFTLDILRRAGPDNPPPGGAELWLPWTVASGILLCAGVLCHRLGSRSA